MDLVTLEDDMFDYKTMIPTIVYDRPLPSINNHLYMYRLYYLVDRFAETYNIGNYDRFLLSLFGQHGYYLRQYYLPIHHKVLIDCVVNIRSLHLHMHYQARLLTRERYMAILNSEYCVFRQGFYSEWRFQGDEQHWRSDEDFGCGDFYRKRIELLCPIDYNIRLELCE